MNDGDERQVPVGPGNWKEVAAILHEALVQIDSELGWANVPLSDRKRRAFGIIREALLETTDDRAFHLSQAHGRILVIIEEWYRDRFGDAVEEDEVQFFVSALLVHGTPFLMRVPRGFRVHADEPGTAWVGFPASVQPEEECLDWIQNRGLLNGLPGSELEILRERASETADLVRSINFDLQLLEGHDKPGIADLARAVRADLQSSARNLCGRSNAGLRSAAWDASQATEKALKILIWRKGQEPPYKHNLDMLAARAESLGSEPIDRAKLAVVPTGRQATDLRYGGEIVLSRAVDAYQAALSIAKQMVFEAKPETKFGFRDARVKIRRPPWFNFDTHAFSQALRSET